MAFFGFSPREKYSVTNTFSAYSLRYSPIYSLAICLFYDFIGDQGPLRFISDNFKDLLENNGVKGVSFIPINIYGSRLQYYALLETQIDSICEHDSDGDHIYGTFQIDFTSWNGEGLFYLKDSGAIVCSLRVKELIERHNISNVSFEGLDKY